MTPTRTGFTLLELAIVLVILGLGAGIVASALHTEADAKVTRSALLSRARRQAIRRAQDVVITMGPEGRVLARTAEGVSLFTDSLAPGPPFSLRISALGVCRQANGLGDAWDALACDSSRRP